ncbi:chemoreceptor glutamine deamidase CheD [Chitinilyticum piscinae]|uniref:Probable chemoreceptor glutamine deamidase CheD n=1 Tax=Chitinilyticum piscinae TaxID=2866724 RepID=A0A8J7FM81_9NEIS|nr:chemoreceptor glutamine deamidase CheD [Chitinilyticum piscinae]MBE9608804.1 chemoreceptor glutamine deamidase CheD [Chitinilyticum piscinae]
MKTEFEQVLSPSVYYDRNFSLEAAKILPGEYYTTSRDMLIVTVLGSCVAACLRDPVNNISGMNHFMLPETGESLAALNGLPTRYGTYAMEMLINQMLKMGAQRNRIQAKIFGGGKVLHGFTVSDVGARNVAFVKRFLELENIPVVAEDLLDIFPRKVYFFSQTGRVLVKKLRSVHNNTIIEREKDYSARLRYQEPSGDVELFS